MRSRCLIETGTTSHRDAALRVRIMRVRILKVRRARPVRPKPSLSQPIDHVPDDLTT